METGCCQNENETCFAKDDEWATCLFECEPGVHEGDGAEFQTPWSCATPDLWKCSKENEDCSETACCQNPDLKCYTKNEEFASCKESCEPGIHDDDDPDFQTPWKCGEVKQACGEVYQQCGGKGWEGATCCKTGCSCEVTSVYYHQCARTDVGVGDNDGSGNTCSGAPAPPPQTEGEASKGHHAKKPARASSSKGAPPPLAPVHAQVAGEKASPKKSKASKGAPPPLATMHAPVAGEKASEDDSDDDDWGDDDDDWDDMDLAEQLPHGAAAVSAERRAGSVGWATAAGLGVAVVLVSAAALARGRSRSSHSHELPGVSEEPLNMELE
jgi:hypothetical protein